MPVEAPLLDFSGPDSLAYKSSEGERPWDGKKDLQKIPKLLIGFLRPATGSQHNFNHILPSLGWVSSAAQSVGLAGTIFQLEVNDSNDNNCC